MTVWKIGGFWRKNSKTNEWHLWYISTFSFTLVKFYEYLKSTVILRKISQNQFHCGHKIQYVWFRNGLNLLMDLILRRRRICFYT